ncbi:STAS domain-containing protein [Streptomyces echinoruber]|uniref:Sulfate transporter n=1 Tax=Streptomyces echinoruber TaxID=68898 RepID=A0A918RFP0_9ACTN|nr:STAS domain-containing protein [Streptomyces echinoruber]GGZ96938.1 sulfate transporter [Streptomyces echinoruber]
MTTLQPPPFRLTVDTGTASAVVRVTGALAYGTHDQLVRTVTALLLRGRAARHPVTELRLDFSGLRDIDSFGLSALLLVRRRADEAGVALRLDARPAVMDRLLEMTGTLEYLTASR